MTNALWAFFGTTATRYRAFPAPRLRREGAGVWTSGLGQPEGLPDGGRRAFPGGDLRAAAQEMTCTPAGVPDPPLQTRPARGAVPEN